MDARAEDAFIRVPRSNLHLFQSLIYSVLPPDRAAFLHDEGYPVDGRRMKLFAMSWTPSGTFLDCPGAPRHTTPDR